MEKLNYLIIHCTASPEGKELTKQDIIRMHTSPKEQGGRGWKKAGYNDIIYLNGDLVNIISFNQNDIVEEWEVANGAKGLNGRSRHIVYVGGCAKNGKTPKDTRTELQEKSLETYVRYTILRHPYIKVLGHNEVEGVKKACPSFNVSEWLKEIGVENKNIYNSK